MTPAPTKPAAGALLAARGLEHRYGSGDQATLAIAAVDLDVQPGEFVSIVGPSGCGKSTLLRIIGGLLTPTAGLIELDGARPEQACRDKRVGFVFQDAALLPWLDVRRNVRLGLDLNRRDAAPAEAEGTVDGLLATVGLAGWGARFPHELSGGMRQRVALARALALSPALLLMDEPLAALDEITRDSMRYELLRLWERTGATVVFVTHSIREAVALSDRVVVLTAGPARVRADIVIELPRPRSYDMERSAAFLDHVGRLRELLL